MTSRMLGPSINSWGKHEISISKDSKPNIIGPKFMSGNLQFQSAELKAAVWFIVAKQNYFSVQSHLYSVETPSSEFLEIQTKIQNILKSQQSQKQNIREILMFTKAGMRLIQEQPWIRLTTDQYDQVRLENQDLYGAKSSELPAIWPPSAQTVSKVLGQGTWNNAMQAIGISINKGKPVGFGKYSEADFNRAITDFVLICGRNATYPSNYLYEEWRANSSWGYPSVGAIRNHFGSWVNALTQNPEFKISIQLHLWENPETSNQKRLTWNNAPPFSEVTYTTEWDD